MKELKVGNSYRVKKCVTGHGYEIGEIITIIEDKIESDDLDTIRDYKANRGSGSIEWYISEDEVEEINNGGFEMYEHHGNKVYVKSSLKGKHREHCLCFNCSKFEPGCSKAKLLYNLCIELKMVTPVWECPDFSEY